MEKTQYRITHRLKTKERYNAVSKAAKKTGDSICDIINDAIDFYLANKLSKGGKK